MTDRKNHVALEVLTTQRPLWLWLVSALLILSGLMLSLLGFWRSYTLVVDGQSYPMKALVFRAGSLLKQVGLTTGKNDLVSTDLQAFSFNVPQTIHITRARKVEIVDGPKIHQLNSASRFPVDLLHKAGISLFPNDLILQNGQAIDPYKALPMGQEAILEYRPAKIIHLNDSGKKCTFSSQRNTLEEAFQEQHIAINEHDRLSMSLNAELKASNKVDIRRARPVVANIGGLSFSSYSAAESAEEALLDIGLPLQNLDYLATDTHTGQGLLSKEDPIQIIQVSETTSWIKEETPYKNTYETDPNAELDTTSVLVPGQTGYVVTREITRFEDGESTKTFPSQHWKASDPIDGVLGRGTLAVIKNEVVDGVTLEYWRKVSVYATSYHPAEFGGSTRTRSGAPLTKGIIAVSSSWYGGMAGQRVYVPGYGFAIIGDSGGGIPGRYWIDLGYDDENYESWHHWTTLYFLTPIPAYIPVVLP